MLGNIFAAKTPFSLRYFGSPVSGHKPAPARLRARGTEQIDTSMVVAVGLTLTSVDHGELTV